MKHSRPASDGRPQGTQFLLLPFAVDVSEVQLVRPGKLCGPSRCAWVLAGVACLVARAEQRAPDMKDGRCTCIGVVMHVNVRHAHEPSFAPLRLPHLRKQPFPLQHHIDALRD